MNRLVLTGNAIRLARAPRIRACETLEWSRSAQVEQRGLIVQGPVSERRLSENSEYVNPEMRETLGFPFQNGRFVKPGKAG